VRSIEAVPRRLRQKSAFRSFAASEAPPARANATATPAPTSARTAATLAHDIDVDAIRAKRFIAAKHRAPHDMSARALVPEDNFGLW
jgi:hypothetical protein